MRQSKKEILTLALGIALLPPLWAIFAPYIGVTTGSVALICAGLYVTNGNKVSDAFKIMMGFLCGDLWAVLSIKLMDILKLNENLELFSVLFILGGMAVIIGSISRKFIFTPAWLCGWAIGLTIMAPLGISGIGTLPIQIAIAMIVGVWYVGAGVDKFHKLILRAEK